LRHQTWLLRNNPDSILKIRSHINDFSNPIRVTVESDSIFLARFERGKLRKLGKGAFSGIWWVAWVLDLNGADGRVFSWFGFWVILSRCGADLNGVFNPTAVRVGPQSIEWRESLIVSYFGTKNWCIHCCCMGCSAQAAPTAKTLRKKKERMRSGRVWRWVPHGYSVLTMWLSELMLSSRDVSAPPSFLCLHLFPLFLLRPFQFSIFFFLPTNYNNNQSIFLFCKTLLLPHPLLYLFIICKI